MNEILINGESKPVHLKPESSFGELYQYIYKNFTDERRLISSLIVDGVEVTPRVEAEYKERSISQFGTVEVTTAHPRELAEDTLQTLSLFTDTLIRLSFRAAQSGTAEELGQNLTKLVEGLDTFTETVTSIKSILRVSHQQTLKLLEIDLGSILTDIFEAKQRNDDGFVRETLKSHLPDNLKQWKEVVIPKLLRLHDV